MVRYLFGVRHLWSRSVVDRDRKVIFIPLPKVASTSMQHLMASRMGAGANPSDFAAVKRAAAAYTLRRTAQGPADAIRLARSCFAFALMRDPISRFISAHDMINTRPAFRAGLERKMGQTLAGEQHVDSLIAYLGRKTIPDWHFLPQNWFLAGLRLDTLIAMEDDIGVALAGHGFADLAAGFGDVRINESRKSNVTLDAKQLEWLEDYYSADIAMYKAIRRFGKA